ncbi:glycoside hydrolase family 32 protein [Paenarthrobacter nitroguajacolicus]|uniref:Glycoside hydrolase family 32 protein n=1 Tax=Paenarthrobacter nitroguajacolicus TaxID=211146 RepID=A0A558H102_PAENT|nr:glycoside hydrolase family 32 protein [Paenarthrobacter nitroguajacolicus]TVU62798.1 glycoside hydrolase family 32 protein [Paenarthrobacter nitroguajacolicus]
MTDTTIRPAGPGEDTAPTIRPLLHYTAHSTWLNDPNGLVFYQGLYHLFYQNNPFDNVWGNMSWGHATSEDLLHWTEHPVAIACDDQEDIFSGSVVVDAGNTAGFGTPGNPALVAIYTSAFKEGTEHQGTQAQSLAFSTDAGMTWHKYAGNPVLGRGSAHFRDPKVFRFEGPAGSYWVMVAVEAQHQEVVLYRSADLKDWEYLSTFGPANATGGEWECPDLFPLPVDGNPDDVRWVMVVNINPGAVAGGSGGQYFVGHFDGVRFTADADSMVEDGNANLRDCLWLDWGRDYYAAVSFSNVPGSRRVMIAWMSNWDYANSLPTSPWRSSMSLAREVGLATVNGRPRLIQRPVLPTDSGRSLLTVADLEVHDSTVALPDAEHGSVQLIEADILPGTARTVALTLLGAPDGGAATVLSFDTVTNQLTLDRRRSGNTSFHAKFASAESTPVTLEDGVLKLQVVVDHGSVEVFAQGGKVTITDLVFPTPGNVAIGLTVEGGTAMVRRLSVTALS